ncbi:Condensin-2 complex subunit H2 [Cryptosporidium felis]|nr:Condensin-2 complex subunit H2 [Cryptosporidium felis]
MEDIPLLKLIENKDPSLNWNIDVSAELEKYLSAIEFLDDEMNYSQHTEVGGFGQQRENQGSYLQLFNFVEAALIIQNSTSLYSKKIEHLHSLVFETFQLLSTGKSQALEAKNETGEEGFSDQLPNKSTATEKGTAFLMSNVISVPVGLLQPGKNISLASERRNDYSSGEPSTKYSSFSSYVGILSLGGNISLTQYRVDKNSNALFLDEGDLVHLSSETSGVERDVRPNVFFENSLVEERGEGQEVEQNIESEQEMEEERDEILGKKFPEALEDEAVRVDYDMGEVAVEGQDFGEDVGDFEGSRAGDPVEGAEADVGIPGSRRKNNEDYWKYMDEHLKLGKDRPLRQGRTCKNPSKYYTVSLQGLPQKEGVLNFVDVYDIRSFLMGETEIGGVRCRVGTQKLPFFPDLKFPKLNIERLFTYDSPENSFFRSIEPEFNETVTSWRKYHARTNLGNIEKRAARRSDTEDAVPDQSDFNEYQEGIFSEFGYSQEPASENELVLENFEDLTLEEKDEEKAEGEDGGGGAGNEVSGSGLPAEGVVFAVNLEQDLTELHARINSWTGQIEPLLQAQNSRPEFNIHEEGRKILEKIKDESASLEKPIGFGQVTQGFSRWEVCRSFLATLMLSNNREIDILDEGEDGETFSIRFLKNGDEGTQTELLDSGANKELDQIEKKSKAKLDFPKRKKTKQDTQESGENTENIVHLENKAGRAQRLSRRKRD